MRAFPGGLFLTLVCVDMGVKQYIEDSFETGEERETMTEKIVLRKVYNRGYLLNSLEDRQDLVRGGSLVTGAALALLDVRLVLMKGRHLEKLGMAVLSAGAFSNIYDRVIRGKVIDYIGFRTRFRGLNRITANLADFYALVGSILASLGRRRK